MSCCGSSLAGAVLVSTLVSLLVADLGPEAGHVSLVAHGLLAAVGQEHGVLALGHVAVAGLALGE